MHRNNGYCLQKFSGLFGRQLKGQVQQISGIIFQYSYSCSQGCHGSRKVKPVNRHVKTVSISNNRAYPEKWGQRTGNPIFLYIAPQAYLFHNATQLEGVRQSLQWLRGSFACLIRQVLRVSIHSKHKPYEWNIILCQRVYCFENR